MAGLKSLKLLLTERLIEKEIKYNNQLITVDFLSQLIDQGQSALDKILPSECVQPEPQTRRYDAALLFLIYPLNILQGEIADQVLDDVINHLQGNYGIRRYLGDTFWCRNYQEIPQGIRTTISVEREQWFHENNWELNSGEEAQWCIFDPIISAIFGLKYQQTKHPEFLTKQTHYFNRSLGQLTDSWQCPELYYLEKGKYLPGDAIPLLWTQANLKISLAMMEKSL